MGVRTLDESHFLNDSQRYNKLKSSLKVFVNPELGQKGTTLHTNIRVTFPTVNSHRPLPYSSL